PETPSAPRGAAADRHVSPRFKCVYPPSEKTQSLIVEHFGFLPVSFIDEIINAANETIYRATDALCKFVETEQGSGEATSQAINKAETMLEHAVDKNFDKFELYALRNLFNIPAGLEHHVVLPHHTQDTPDEYTDEALLDKELGDVRRQIVANNMMRARLARDTALVEKRVVKLRSLNEQIHIGEIASRELKGEGPESVAAVREKVDQLRQILEQLDLDVLSKMDAINEPAGRDVYLAKLTDMQVSRWEQGQQGQQEQEA
ncbi:hypothetical protein EC988_005110, partial [Linderina pennispora]